MRTFRPLRSATTGRPRMQFLASTLVAAAVSACAEDSGPTSAGGSFNGAAGLGAGGAATPAAGAGGAAGYTADVEIATAVIGLTGGALKVSGATLTIPPGALSRDTAITIRRLAAPPGALADLLAEGTAVYELLPEGTTFAKDVEMRFSAPAAPDAIGVLWTENGKVAMAPFERDGDEVLARANHFSYTRTMFWRDISDAAWLAAQVVDANITVIGSTTMALFCKTAQRGGLNQRPCPGPNDGNGVATPLCLGSLFTSFNLSVNSSVNRCLTSECFSCPEQCQSNGQCPAPTCADDLANGTETDVDCGGSACAPCADGRGCDVGPDCESEVCASGACAPSTCTDDQINGKETDTDCGGDGPCPRCATGQKCAFDADCAGVPNAAHACRGGVCAFDCNSGLRDCNGLLNDGCEINVTTSPEHCGACAQKCASVAHGSPSCVESVCKAVCEPFFGDCNGTYADGCEAALASDAKNCGKCGASCPISPNGDAPTCGGGACSFAMSP